MAGKTGKSARNYMAAGKAVSEQYGDPLKPKGGKGKGKGKGAGKLPGGKKAPGK